MDLQRTDAEALRRRLYRPGASEADLTSYLDHTDPGARAVVATVPDQIATVPDQVDAGPPPDTRPMRPRDTGPRRRRTLVLAAAGGAVVLLAGTAIAVGTLAPTTAPAPIPSSVVASWTAAPRDPGDAMVATAVLDGGRRAHATGEARSVEQGYLYTVGRADTVFGIAERFGLCTADVLTALPYGADAGKLSAGERLLLTRGLGTPATAGRPGTC